ncbi:MAG: hypothetical protein ACHREM_32500 [Polyangiales bacterium]
MTVVVVGIFTLGVGDGSGLVTAALAALGFGGGSLRRGVEGLPALGVGRDGGEEPRCRSLTGGGFGDSERDTDERERGGGN